MENLPIFKDINKEKMFVINQHNFGAIPTNGLIHHWPLQGDKIDLIGGINWVAYGTESYGTNRKGEANKAAIFTDYTTYFQLASDLNIGKLFSVSFWVYKNASTAVMILNKWSTSGLLYSYNYGKGYAFRTINSSYNITLSPIFDEEAWYHFVIVRNNANAYLYVNNLKYTISESVENQDNIIRTLNKRYLSNDNIYTLNGKLSDVRIYDRVLTDSEIYGLYTE